MTRLAATSRNKNRKSARISHRICPVADPGLSTALRSVGFLDVLSSMPAESDRHALCIHAHLRSLATKPLEKCALATEGMEERRRIRKVFGRLNDLPRSPSFSVFSAAIC